MSAVEALRNGRMKDGKCSVCGRSRMQHGSMSCREIDEIADRAFRAALPLRKRLGRNR